MPIAPVWGLWKCGCCGSYVAGEPAAYSTQGPVCGICNVRAQAAIEATVINADLRGNYTSARQDFDAYKKGFRE